MSHLSGFGSSCTAPIQLILSGDSVLAGEWALQAESEYYFGVDLVLRPMLKQGKAELSLVSCRKVVGGVSPYTFCNDRD